MTTITLDRATAAAIERVLAHVQAQTFNLALTEAIESVRPALRAALRETLAHPAAMPIVGLCPKTGRPVVEFESLKSAHRAGYKAPNISKCLTGDRLTHRGLAWARREERRTA